MARCKGTNARGERCHSRAMHGADYCYCHSNPGAWRAAQARGGEASHGPRAPLPPYNDSVDLTTSDGVRSLLADALRLTRTGALDTKVANALAALANSQRAYLELTDIERRLTALEEQLLRGST